MTKSSTDEAAKTLGKSLRNGHAHAQPATREPQEESLKHHGDDLQDVVDKATGVLGKPH
jgi:hypothetical protein